MRSRIRRRRVRRTCVAARTHPAALPASRRLAAGLCVNNCSYPRGHCVDGTCVCHPIPHPYNNTFTWDRWGFDDCSGSECPAAFPRSRARHLRHPTHSRVRVPASQSPCSPLECESSRARCCSSSQPPWWRPCPPTATGCCWLGPCGGRDREAAYWGGRGGVVAYCTWRWECVTRCRRCCSAQSRRPRGRCVAPPQTRRRRCPPPPRTRRPCAAA